MTPKCSLKIFIADLQDLEKEGIVGREVIAEVPRKVDYNTCFLNKIATLK